MHVVILSCIAHCYIKCSFQP